MTDLDWDEYHWWRRLRGGGFDHYGFNCPTT